MHSLARKMIQWTLISTLVVIGIPAILVAFLISGAIVVQQDSAEWDRKLEADLGHVADTGQPTDELSRNDFICFNDGRPTHSWCSVENPLESEKDGEIGFIRGNEIKCRLTNVRYVLQSNNVCIKPSSLTVKREVAKADMPQARPFRPKAGEAYFKITQREP
jgi:hypothetical protein